MDKWEYKRTDETFEEELNTLGAQGWELVGVVNDTTGKISTAFSRGLPGDTTGRIDTRVQFIFKRHKP